MIWDHCSLPIVLVPGPEPDIARPDSRADCRQTVKCSLTLRLKFGGVSVVQATRSRAYSIWGRGVRIFDRQGGADYEHETARLKGTSRADLSPSEDFSSISHLPILFACI